jgi:hemolysin-activating ACP:hemolysin acyltransferase
MMFNSNGPAVGFLCGPGLAFQAADAAISSVNTQPHAAPVDAARSNRAAGRALMASFGEIVAIAMRSKHSQAIPIGELELRVVPAVMTGQFMLAGKRSAKSGLVTPTTALLWAQVSGEVDQRLSNVTQPGSNTLDVKEWASGRHVWLVEAFGERALVPQMIEQLKQTSWKGQPIKMRVQDGNGVASVNTISPS